LGSHEAYKPFTAESPFFYVNSWILFGIHLCITFFTTFTGLMADKLGSYAAAFYTSGAVLIAGASITSLMACVKKRQEKSETQSYSVEKLLVTEKITVL